MSPGGLTALYPTLKELTTLQILDLRFLETSESEKIVYSSKFQIFHQKTRTLTVAYHLLQLQRPWPHSCKVIDFNSRNFVFIAGAELEVSSLTHLPVSPQNTMCFILSFDCLVHCSVLV